MDKQMLQGLLDALEDPAFVAEQQRVTAENEAFRSLQIAEGTPLSDFFSINSISGSEEGSCIVAGAAYRVRTVPVAEATLYLLKPEQESVSVQVLAHAAKRLRAALQQMYSALDTLDLQLPDTDETADKSMSSLLQGIFRLERMADNMEYLQRLKGREFAPSLTRLDLCAALRRILEKAEWLLSEAKIQLHWQLPNGVFQGSMDEKLLSLLVWNLLANAAAHAEGGSVTVQVERVRLTKLRIRVTDSGSSISAGQLPDLLERYKVPLEEAMEQPGIGLGLSLVRAVTMLFAGSMAISMEPGGATTVAVCLETGFPAEPTLHSRTELFVRSLDDGLVGLADVLPRRLYDRRDILS